MSDPERALGPVSTRRADGLLVVAMALLALLLGCYELFDTDVWWHLRTGRWILEHHRVPRLDIFTFSSADRAWIDLHWGFQVALAMAHALGGVPGMILLAAAAASVAVTLAVTARRRDWPSWAVALCWLPALALMATRFDPRPEVFSLVGLAAFLAVLLRVEDRPAMAWALPIIQVLWVNVHGLFILGPIVLGCYWLDRGARVMLAMGRGRFRSRNAAAVAASGTRLGRGRAGHPGESLRNPRGDAAARAAAEDRRSEQPLQVVHRRVRRPPRGGPRPDADIPGDSLPHPGPGLPAADDGLELPAAGRLAALADARSSGAAGPGHRDRPGGRSASSSRAGSRSSPRWDSRCPGRRPGSRGSAGRCRSCC